MVKKNENNRANYLDPIKTTSQKRDEENLKDFKFGIKLTSGRLYFFTVSLLVIFAIYLVLYFLQFFTNFIPLRDEQHLARETNARIQRNVIVSAPRGQILDAQGKVLATSIPYQTFGLDVKVFLDPAYAAVNQENSPVFQALAQALGVDPKKLYQDILRRPNSRYLRLKSQVSPTMADYIKSLKVPGLSSYTDFRRFYPYGDAVSQVIGLLDNEGQGMFGVERLANTQLLGKDGNISYEKDFSNNIINYKNIANAQAGQDIILTINMDLQEMAYQALNEAIVENKADTATAVLVDVTNGNILAMANAPSFNPNNRSKLVPEYLNNYAITSVFEPGSTVKPFVVYSGLLTRVITPTTVINTRNLTVGRHQVKDVGPRDTLSIRGILQRSSNIGVAKISLLLPGDSLRETYLAAGFGQKTGLGLSGETMGYFPYNNRLTDLDKAVFSYGYMQQVTPLQLAHVYATLGNFGAEYPLSLIKSQTPPQAEQKLNANIVKTVLELMEGVAESGGGGTRAAIPNYNVSVKTGTAKKVEGGQYVDKYIAYTAGVAPSTRPRFALVIVINNPKGEHYYGGAIAAPVWRKIMEATLNYYNIPEDKMSSDRILLHSGK